MSNVDFQIKSGVDGIILGGTLGEASALVDDEKSLLTRATKEHVDGKLPVIVNIAEQTTMGAIAAAKLAEQDGADGLMMLPPMRYEATEDETVAYFKAIANSTDLEIMIYNNPIDYKIKVTPTGEFFWEAAFTFRRDMDGGSSDKDDIEYHYNDQLVYHLPKDFDTQELFLFVSSVS